MKEQQCKECPMFKQGVKDLELKDKVLDLHNRLQFNNRALEDAYELQEAKELVKEIAIYLERSICVE